VAGLQRPDDLDIGPEDRGVIPQAHSGDVLDAAVDCRIRGSSARLSAMEDPGQVKPVFASSAIGVAVSGGRGPLHCDDGMREGAVGAAVVVSEVRAVLRPLGWFGLSLALGALGPSGGA
jgi:hypothetical protein